MKNLTVNISLDNEKIDELRNKILKGASRGNIDSLEHVMEIFKKELSENIQNYIKTEQIVTKNETTLLKCDVAELKNISEIVMNQLRHEPRRKKTTDIIEDQIIQMKGICVGDPIILTDQDPQEFKAIVKPELLTFEQRKSLVDAMIKRSHSEIEKGTTSAATEIVQTMMDFCVKFKHF